MEVIKENDKRFYISSNNNKKYISVTSLVGLCFCNIGLQYWKNNTPIEEQKAISEKSLAIGNTFHKEVENYYLNNKANNNLDKYVLDYLTKLNLNSVKTEVPFIYSNSNLGYAGTIDCLADFNNEKVVIDWKTTKKKKYHANLLGYFLQLSAYCKAFKVSKGLLVLNNYTKQEFNTYLLTNNELDFYYEWFCTMLYDFTNNTDYFRQRVMELESKEYRIKEFSLA